MRELATAAWDGFMQAFKDAATVLRWIVKMPNVSEVYT